MINPLQQAILMYSAELSSQILIIVFTNKVPVASYSFESFNPESTIPFPASGSIRVIYKEEIWILKWVIDKDATGIAYQIDAIIFNPKNAPPAILGTNGENISRLRSDLHRTIGIKFDSADATETAKGLVIWLFQEIGKIDKEVI